MVPWRWPIPDATVTQDFYTVIDDRGTLHAGIDFAAPFGTGVRSPADGVVVAWRQYAAGTETLDRSQINTTPIGRDDPGYEWIAHGYGSWVLIDHGDEFSLHGHTAPGVARGQQVIAGEPIGSLDQTGYAKGAHVHLERRTRQMERLDPMDRFQAEPEPGPGDPTMRGRNALVGRMGIWLRQYSDTAERTLTRIIDTLHAYGGYDLLVLKVADGLNWQSANDPTMPLRSTNDLLAIQSFCESRGVSFCPVVVPRGLRGEAQFHGEIARAAGVLMTDIEPYQHFWDQAPYDQIPWYTRELRQEASGAYLVNQPDPRIAGRRDAKVDETAGHFDAICAQHYVGWSSVGWTDVANEVRSFDSLAALGREMYVTLYGVERIDLAGAFWRHVVDRSLGGHVFAMGVMNAEELRFFGGLPRSPKPQPKPDPKPDPLPDPTPAPTIEQVKLGLIRKLLDDEWRAARDDLNKIVGV